MGEKEEVLFLEKSNLEDWEKLLIEKGYAVEDIREAFEQKIEHLKQKKTIRENHPLGGYREHKAGRFVTQHEITKGYPLKMFVLQEIVDKEWYGEAPYLRFGYYIVSWKTLKKKGKLSILWGQFNPSISKGDLTKLIRKATDAGIIRL